MVSRSKRLQMMFAGDEELLHLDTRLTLQPVQETPETTVPATVPSTMPPVVPAIEPQPVTQTKPNSSPRMNTKIPEWELRNAFCPARALPKFPFKYVLPKGGALSKQIAREYFDGGAIWNRLWEVYYLPIPWSITEQPLLLISALQVKDFFDKINYELNCDISLKRNQEGLVVFFDANDGTPQPVFHGRIENRGGLDIAEKSIPEPESGDENWTKKCEPAAVRAFAKKVHEAILAYKKKKIKPKSRVPNPLKDELEWRMIQQPPGRGLYHLMSFLGLRPPLYDDNWLNGGEVYDPVNLLEPVRWEPQDSPIFYSVDVEWNERNFTQLTEIGISMLDTLDIRGIPPGVNGENWVKHIKSAHLRTAEYKNFRNSQFVMGYPDMFLFGKSEIVPNEQMGRRTDLFFATPYDGTEDKNRPDLPEHRLVTRNIVLVGHNPDADIKMLAERCTIFNSMDLRPQKLIRSLLDTQELFQRLRTQKNPSKLETILIQLGLEPEFLHNAGNDARYTLEALIRMAMELAAKKMEPKQVSDEEEDPEWKIVEEEKTEQQVVVQEAEVSSSEW
ncbi:uncharacterized protein N7473_007108 [Penicillium subrubescens]|uniref:uncharacterized protein n=1 Tax=Penicillium subrubescens TaxID=1316194 RepID=UPI0025457B87|nr:uncharacterized protein N7473_007108 [Penicillium subrubescens]KAJ5890880.1 hypothetical protein N7473_007108 [Penicillium subrubescens]